MVFCDGSCLSRNLQLSPRSLIMLTTNKCSAWMYDFVAVSYFYVSK